MSHANYTREKAETRNQTRLQVSPAKSEGYTSPKQTGASWEWVYEKLHSAIKVRHSGSENDTVVMVQGVDFVTDRSTPARCDKRWTINIFS